MLHPKNLKPGYEQWEDYCDHCGTWRVQYDYRDPTGQLFSCVRRKLNECRQARDEWLEKKRLAKQGERDETECDCSCRG